MTNDLNQTYATWATNAFSREVRDGFRQAEIFDGIISRQCVMAVKKLSHDQQQILTYLLPRGVAVEDPAVAATRYNLQETELQALMSFITMRGRLQREMSEERSQRIGVTSKPQFQLEFRAARRECDRQVGDIGRAWNCRILRAGSGEWCFVTDRAWGELRIAWKLQRDLEITYSISIESSQFGGITAGHYLGALGIGPSLWLMEDSTKCVEVVAKARDFIWWHIEECERIVTRFLDEKRA